MPFSSNGRIGTSLSDLIMCGVPSLYLRKCGVARCDLYAASLRYISTMRMDVGESFFCIGKMHTTPGSLATDSAPTAPAASR